MHYKWDLQQRFWLAHVYRLAHLLKACWHHDAESMKTNAMQRKKFIIIVSGVYIALLYTALNFFLFVFSLTCIIFINRRVSFILHCRCGNINFGNRKACLLCRGKQISDETENSGMCTLLWFRICIPVLHFKMHS